MVEHTPLAPRGEAVLLLGPLGYEDTSAYRPLRQLADLLADEGFTVLRPDWPGLGDSAGEATDEDLVSRAVAAVHRAVAHLRERGFVRIVGVGVRAGALLALAAAATDELVLWAPPPRGRAYLREERAFHKLAAKAYGPPPPEAHPAPVGAVEAGGFLYNAAVVDQIEGMEPAALVRGAALRRVLLLEREGAAAPEPFLAALRASGAELTAGLAVGLADLLENPYHSKLAPEVAGAVLAWCSAGSGRSAAVRGAEGTAKVLVLPGGVEERPWIGRGGAGELVGVVCEPPGGAAPGAAWTLFFNAGGIRRSGPNRLWTTAARALAAAGRPSLRFDVRDVGDSDGVTTPHADLEAMYSEDSIDDALAAYDAVLGLGAGSIDVVGLCSGAFLGMQVSARRAVRRALLFNGLAFVWNDDARANGMTAHIGRSLLDARRWRRLLTGRIDARALAGAVVSKARLTTGAAVARVRGRAPPDEVGELIRSVLARGTDLQLVSSAGDPSIAYFEAHVHPEHRPRLAVLSGVDHTIRPLWSHAAVVRWIQGASDL